MPTTLERSATPIAATHQPRLMDRVRECMRVAHYARRTEAAYCHWILAYIRHHGRRHPAEMGAAEIEAYLTHLATERDVSASTQNQALHALLYLYRQVLGIDLPWLDGITRARESRRLPAVLTQRETAALLRHVHGTPGLVIKLLYGTGMRLLECLRLRALAGWRERAIGAALAQIKAREGGAVALVWYATPADWATLPGREPVLWRPQQSVCAALAGAMPDRLRLVPFDAPAYAEWLGWRGGGEDDEARRGAWAATAIS